MQYMSQAMGWADCIVLGMAPLGIITAIVAAIRVGSTSWLKAIIGRARESRAIPEAELMSSRVLQVAGWGIIPSEGRVHIMIAPGRYIPTLGP